MATIGYPHISLDSANIPVLAGDWRMKVVEIVCLITCDMGFDAAEIQRQFPFLTLGDIDIALAVLLYDHPRRAGSGYCSATA